jgi:hypothetical protein
MDCLEKHILETLFDQIYTQLFMSPCIDREDNLASASSHAGAVAIACISYMDETF